MTRFGIARRGMKGIAAIGLAVALSAAAGSAAAAECAGVRFPDETRVGDAVLRLNGLGLREATIFKVDVYVAGLYLEAPSSDPAAVLNAPGRKRLILRFVRDVDRGDIVEAWNEGFEKAAGAALDGLADRIATLNGWMPDIKSGGILDFTYDPAAGLRVAVGDAVRGVIPGDDFARAFFAIWLGDSPPNPGLKAGLLGGACG